MDFLMLGPLGVRSFGEEVRVGGTRQRKLLAFLLLNVNRVLPLERLVDELWEFPPRSARQQIHNAIGDLRRVLSVLSDGVMITTTDVGYQFAVPEKMIDAYHFHRYINDAREAEGRGRIGDAVQLLRSGLGLWRGPALEGLDSPKVASAAAKLDEQRLTAVENMMTLRLKAGETSSVVGELQELVAAHPLRESLRQSLMIALYRSDRHADALAVYDEGRRVLAEELGLDPGPRLRALQGEILRGDSNVGPPTVEEVSLPATPTQTPSRPKEPSPPRPASRCFLPHDTQDFAGRTVEIAHLLTEARRASPTALTISSIDGMGGVGKTALAVHLGHLLTKDYPDGQYFIDLHGFSLGIDPVSPEQALDTLLRANGVPPEIIPSSLEERSALWRSTVAGQRALVVLDNATDAAQVRPLLPGTLGALVITTSRRKLTAIDGAVPVSLETLPLDDAIALFTRVAGPHRIASEPDNVARAVDLCGRLPLAIRIAAARLRDRTTWTVADLVDRLETPSRRTRFLQVGDRNVMSVLRLSYRYLSAVQQRVFRLLSIHRGPDFDAYSAAALTGLSLDEAESCLDALFEDNLLRQDVAGRFYFHDLIRDCSRQLLIETETDSEQRAAQKPLLDYYLHSAYSWCRHLGISVYRITPQEFDEPAHIRVVESRDDAIRTLDAEYGNLVATAKSASADDWNNHSWQLTCILQTYMKLTNYGEVALALFQDGLRAARVAKDLRGQSACLHGLSLICQEHRSYTEAREYLTDAIALSREIDDPIREGAQLITLGSLYLNGDHLAEARDAWLAADAIGVSNSDRHLRVTTLNNLGTIFRDLGEFDQALEYFERARAGDPSRPQIPWNIGMVYHFQCKQHEAIRELKQGLRVSTATQFHHGKAFALASLCAAHRSLGEFAEALDYGRRALSIARDFTLRVPECAALCGLGEVLVSTGDLDRAEEVYSQAEARAREYRHPRYIARAIEGFAHIAFARGLLPDARRHWEQAIRAYPDGMAAAEYARQHLASLSDGSTRCFRCEIQASGR